MIRKITDIAVGYALTNDSLPPLEGPQMRGGAKIIGQKLV